MARLKGPSATPSGMRGLTLLELIVTLAVAAILATVAVPSFTSFIGNQRVKASSQGLYTGLLLARAEAIKRNAEVAVKPLAADDWSRGWQVVHGNQVIRQQEFKGIVVTTDTTELKFTRVGRLQDNVEADFSFCDAASSAGIGRRQISLSANGRPNIIPAGSCSS